MNHMLRIACLLAASALIVASRPSESPGAESPTDAVIRASLPKIVKLYGAGGFRGLEAYGTGFLVSAEGHVVTSWRPLLDAEPVTAVLDDGRRFAARLTSADPEFRLALLKLEGPGAPFPHFDLDEAVDVEPGDRILALSNMFRVAAGDEPVSVMHGMILARAPLVARRGRFETSLDVPVYYLDSVTNNPGAAGGVIVSLDGRIAGMIGQELRGEGTETWINYALPATTIADRVSSLLDGGEANRSPLAEQPDPATMRRPIDVGLTMVPDVTVRTPAYVTDVLEGSAAEAAGLLRDDLILFANGGPVRSIRELTTMLSRAERGDEIQLVVRRGGQLKPLQLVIP